MIFANDYVIDRPIRLGMTLAQARVETEVPFTGDEYPFHPIGVSIRGLCGPATRRNGAALLQASRDFRPEDLPPATAADPHPVLFGDSWSLMIVRTFAPVSIDNVVFDANGYTKRCLTIMTFGSTHHHVLEGCTFKNAVHAQLYIGGEVPTVVRTDRPEGDIIDVRARYYSGGQDLGDMRVTRCHFETGGGEGERLSRPQFRKLDPQGGKWRHGVVYRAEPALGTEFHGCVFRGQGSPMFLAVGGRLSFQDCAFDTDEVEGNPRPSTRIRPAETDLRWWNGTDIHLAAGFAEYLWRRGVEPSPDNLQPIAGAMLTARNVTSCSRQFLSTHPDIERIWTTSTPTFASVTLLHVRHRSRFTGVGEARRPAIYWGAPRLVNCALVMEGCAFNTPPLPIDSAYGANPRGGVFIAALSTESDPAPVVVLATRRSGDTPVLCSTADVIPNVMMIPE